MALADRLSPPLTTIRVQHYKAGLESAELIVDIVENATHEPRHIVLPVELIVRGSTRVLTDGVSETAGHSRNRKEELS